MGYISLAIAAIRCAYRKVCLSYSAAIQDEDHTWLVNSLLGLAQEVPNNKLLSLLCLFVFVLFELSEGT